MDYNKEIMAITKCLYDKNFLVSKMEIENVTSYLLNMGELTFTTVSKFSKDVDINEVRARAILNFMVKNKVLKKRYSIKCPGCKALTIISPLTKIGTLVHCSNCHEIISTKGNIIILYERGE